MSAETDSDNSLVVPVRALHRGSRGEIQGVRDGRLRIKTTAAPADGGERIQPTAVTYRVDKWPIATQQYIQNFRSDGIAVVAGRGNSETLNCHRTCTADGL